MIREINVLGNIPILVYFQMSLDHFVRGFISELSDCMYIRCQMSLISGFHICPSNCTEITHCSLFNHLSWICGRYSTYSMNTWLVPRQHSVLWLVSKIPHFKKTLELAWNDSVFLPLSHIHACNTLTGPGYHYGDALTKIHNSKI